MRGPHCSKDLPSEVPPGARTQLLRLKLSTRLHVANRGRVPLPVARRTGKRAYRASAICRSEVAQGHAPHSSIPESEAAHAYLSPFVLAAYGSLRSNAYAVLTAV